MATPAFELPFSVRPTNPVPVDAYSGPGEGYVDLAAARLAVPEPVRYPGLTVRIQSPDGVVEYWWRLLTTDAGLIAKNLANPQTQPGPEFTIEGITEFLDRFPSVKTGDAEAFFRTLLVKYQSPVFGAFTYRGISSTTGELGTAYPAGLSQFAWATTNAGEVKPNTIKITDVTASTVLATGLANDGIEDLSTAAFSLIAGESRRFRIEGMNTNNALFTADVVLFGAAAIFWGSTAARPADSAAVRALSNYQLTNQGNTLLLNTGTSNRIFALWLPAGLSLQQVLDLDAANANLTSQYVGTAFSVNDAGGAPVAGTLYVMEQAVPYSANHRHQLSIG